jgi:hypothetical protein
LTTVQTAIWLDRDYGNRLNLGPQFIDEVVINLDRGDRSCVRFQEVRIFARFSGSMSGLYLAHLRNKEAISALGNGLDVAGVLGIIAKRFPQFANGDTEAAVEVDKRIVAPDAMA